MIQTYLKAKLMQSGFPQESNIEYSLSSCQGDGVAFYCSLDSDDLSNLIPQCYKEATKAQRDCLQFFIEETASACEISRNGNGLHYSHYNTMDLIVEDDWDWVCSSEDAADIAEMSLSRFKRGRRHFHSFCESLSAYIVDVSKNLERKGYNLIDSFIEEEIILTSKQTKNLNIQVKTFALEENFDDYSMFFSEYDLDMNNINSGESALSTLVETDMKALLVKAEISNREGLVLGEYDGGLVFSSNPENDPKLLPYIRSVVAEAATEVRCTMKNMPVLRK